MKAKSWIYLSLPELRFRPIQSTFHKPGCFREIVHDTQNPMTLDHLHYADGDTETLAVYKTTGLLDFKAKLFLLYQSSSLIPPPP